jgi:ABC-2 type transport system ATP-binding protein
MIEIKHLQKIEAGRTILDLDEITIQPGEVSAIIGAADSGIDSLLNLLLGRSLPSSGSILINGKVPTRDRNELKEQTGFLFKDNALYQEQSAEKNLLFFANLYGLPKTRPYEILQEAGLADQAVNKVKDLSSGLARRLAFGRALLHQPEALILEQPFSYCDEQSIKVIQNLILKESQNRRAILILNQDDTHLKSLCSKIFVLKQGTIEEIIEPYADQTTDLPFKIPVKLEGRVALLNPRDILYAEAHEGQALLITNETSYDSQFTLNELEDRLNGYGFFRAHRSYLVNLQYVKEIIPYSRNSFTLRLTDPNITEIPLSKYAATELRDLLGY